VARKDMQDNTLWVVQGHDHLWLQSSTLDAQNASWISGTQPPSATMAAKTRYRQNDAPCEFSAVDLTRFSLAFAQPQWAVTPGQSAVVYDGDICLGGGVIESSHAGK
jgi:tRNA-specific 2-thiouridylase